MNRLQVPARLRFLLAFSAVAALVGPSVLASDTPDPASVTIAGSLQSELGCAGDWMPDCAATHLTYDGSDGIWQQVFTLPAGSYEYKAPLNDAWTENYGLNAVRDGANIPLTSTGAPIKFYYDHETHWVTDNVRSVIAVAPGASRASWAARETGCPIASSRGWRTRTGTASTRSPRRRFLRGLRDEGGPQRDLGRELRRGRRSERKQHSLFRPLGRTPMLFRYDASTTS